MGWRNDLLGPGKKRWLTPAMRANMAKSALRFDVKCEVCYVGKTRRHLQARFKENLRGGPVKAHLETCIDGITQDSVDILGSISKGEVNLLTLEALWIRELKPFLNTQDTMRSRDLKLTIKF